MSAKRRSNRSFQHHPLTVSPDHEETDAREGSSSGSSRKLSQTSKTTVDWLGDDVDRVDDCNYFSNTKIPVGLSFYSTEVVGGGHRSKTKKSTTSIWNRLKKGARGLWKTRYTDDSDDPELIVKTTLRELAIYIVFLLLICIITFAMRDSTMYHFTKVMRDLLTPKFEKISDFKGLFEYTEGDLMDALYKTEHYNDEEIKDHRKGYIMENKILGVPRLRQVRVRSDSCVVAKDFENDIHVCYAPYSTGAEAKEQIDKNGTLMNGSAWEYSSEKEINGTSLLGRISTYSGGGYYALLGDNRTHSETIISNLKENRWLDRGTRAVFIDFTVYNANINLFCVVTLVLECPATGGCIPYTLFRTLKFLRYVSAMDMFVMACEGVFVALLVYYFIEEFIEIQKHKWSYFCDVWNIFDLIVLAIGIVCAGVNIYRTLEVTDLLERLEHSTKYASFEELSYWQMQFNDFLAVACFIAWIKIFKYISFNNTMSQLQTTLSRSAKDIVSFAVMFFIVFFAFAQLGYLIFGKHILGFSTFLNSIFSLFRTILGDFDFVAMEQANRFLGPLFFITYVFFVFFVLTNMFLAIINDTYAEVKSELAEQEAEFLVGDYFRNRYAKMMTKLSFKREKIVDTQEAIKAADLNQDNKLNYDEWRAELKRRGHAEKEIEGVFEKFDVDGDHVLNELEKQHMLDDLEGERSRLDDELKVVSKTHDEVKKLQSRLSLQADDEHIDRHTEDISYDELSVLTRRVDRLEHRLGNIVSKLGAALQKMDTIEKEKLQRRKTMASLLDSIIKDGGRLKEMERLIRSDLVGSSKSKGDLSDSITA